ncbi:MAG TPA: urease accessory protein UreF [Hyphomicrobiaceae bacterium]|nr:urease accessory protein UreF [Hyphomicrobiaceae bacterium]
MALDPPSASAPNSAVGHALPPEQLLNVWLSPAFPVGSFAYSHGLECAVETGLVADAAGLRDWLGDLVSHGSAWNDLVLASIAMRATSERAWPSLAGAAEIALALQPSAERHLETSQQGGSFLDQILAAWRHPVIDQALMGLHDGDRREPIAYPIAFAIAAGAHGVPIRASLIALGLAFAGNLVSAAIRLSVLGQTDGQRVIASLSEEIASAADRAASASEDELGSMTLVSDLMSIEHETQRTRLFRS